MRDPIWRHTFAQMEMQVHSKMPPVKRSVSQGSCKIIALREGSSDLRTCVPCNCQREMPHKFSLGTLTRGSLKDSVTLLGFVLFVASGYTMESTAGCTGGRGGSPSTRFERGGTLLPSKLGSSCLKPQRM